MKFTLTAANIAGAISEAEQFLQNCRGNKKDKTRMRLWLEETLLTYREKFGESAECTVQMGKTLGTNRIRLTVGGEMLDPFAVKDEAEQESLLMRSFLTSLGQRPTWRYTRGRNVVTLSMASRTVSSLGALLIAVAAAIVLGLVMRLSPENVRLLVQEGIIAPATDAFIGFLNAIATPMIFLAVVWGIYSMGDTNTFNEIGTKVCGRFLLVLSLLTILMTAVIAPFFKLTLSSTAELGSFAAIYEMVLDIVPDNIFTPFARGNTLQILFVAVIIGITMIVIGEKTQGVALISEQLNCIVQTIMDFVGRLVPYFIFGSLFNIISESDFLAFAVFRRFFFSTILACALLLAAHTVITCVKLRISPKLLWEKALPAFVVALSTASSSAAFSSNLGNATKKFGISDRLANFGVPVGQVLYKPGVAAVFLCAAVSVAESSGVSVSPVWFVSAVIMCIILSVATPTIPGGTAASFSVLFAQLGLPQEQLATILALNMLLDFVHTAANIFGDQCVLLIVADNFKMVNRAVLERPAGRE